MTGMALASQRKGDTPCRPFRVRQVTYGGHLKQIISCRSNEIETD
jgi:hypothetical protein